MRYFIGIIFLIGCGEASFRTSSGGTNESRPKFEAPVDSGNSILRQEQHFGDGKEIPSEPIPPVKVTETLDMLLFGGNGDLKLGHESTGCESLKDSNLSGITRFSPNLVPDGEFESEKPDFETTYRYNDLQNCSSGSNSLVPDIGEYSIVSNPNRCHRGWDVLNDSKIAIFNGARGTSFWCRSFEVHPNVDYAFSVRERLLHPDAGENSSNGSSPIKWVIDGKEVLAPVSPKQQWRTRGAIWKSTTKKFISICGLNNSDNNSGNDWAIDDICLVPQALTK